jgi:hypothetical protein
MVLARVVRRYAFSFFACRNREGPSAHPEVFSVVESRRRGSHLRIECGRCVTTVPVHAGEDNGPGLLRRFERDLEPCLGKGWLKRP